MRRSTPGAALAQAARAGGRVIWGLVAAATLTLTAPAAAQDEDIADRLRAVPGLTVLAEHAAPSPYRSFVLSFRQPADHRRPLMGHFEQRLTLLHRDTDAPVVLHSTGYNVRVPAGRVEVTRLVDGNQVSVEHRFFTPSRPDPAAWSDLTIWQAATDHHRLVEALGAVYDGRWLSTGGSKGGMTSIYHRRFYPEDIDGTVAYVAPNDVVNAEDSAYTTFFETVGTKACRDALTAVEREALGPRRGALLARFEATAAASGWTFDNTLQSADRALEMVVLDTAWAFWQFRGHLDCSSIPAPTASTDDLYAFLDDTTGFGFYTDEGLEPYIPYYFQAGTQLGWPSPDFDRLEGLLRYPSLYSPRSIVPSGLDMRFEPQRMRDVDGWVRHAGSELLFVYGEFDPWGAERFRIGPGTRDAYVFEVPFATHRTSIAALPDADEAQATLAVQRWAGIATAARGPSAAAARDPRLDHRGGEVPPRRRP